MSFSWSQWIRGNPSASRRSNCHGQSHIQRVPLAGTRTRTPNEHKHLIFKLIFVNRRRKKCKKIYPYMNGYRKLHNPVYTSGKSNQSRVTTGKNSNAAACPKSLQGRAWQGESSWLLLFGGWIKLATPSLLPKQGDNSNRQSGILLKCI